MSDKMKVGTHKVSNLIFNDKSVLVTVPTIGVMAAWEAEINFGNIVKISMCQIHTEEEIFDFSGLEQGDDIEYDLTMAVERYCSEQAENSKPATPELELQSLCVVNNQFHTIVYIDKSTGIVYTKVDRLLEDLFGALISPTPFVPPPTPNPQKKLPEGHAYTVESLSGYMEDDIERCTHPKVVLGEEVFKAAVQHKIIFASSVRDLCIEHYNKQNKGEK